MILSHAVPRVHIYGDRDLFVTSSASVQLKCIISRAKRPPNYIEWRKDGRTLAAFSASSGTSVGGARVREMCIKLQALAHSKA